MVMVDPTRTESERYLIAMSSAVQASGIADRIGMSQSSQVVQTKMLDYFFSLRALHGVIFQPIVEIATMELHEYECLFRPQMPQVPRRSLRWSPPPSTPSARSSSTSSSCTPSSTEPAASRRRLAKPARNRAASRST